MKRNLDHETLVKLLHASDLDSISYAAIENLFIEEASISEYKPDGLCQIDPRNGDRIIYNSARARRPHDNTPAEKDKIYTGPKQECVICQGKTTQVLDVAALSDGFTFINKNLFPILYPSESAHPYPADPGNKHSGSTGFPAHGLHFLQWTSSYHNRDWHNMPLDDRMVVLERLAVLEHKMLTDSGAKMPTSDITPNDQHLHGYVSIIKNFGRLVGGSLAHGHQQIAFSNILPRRTRDNWRYFQDHGETFSSYLLRENPSDFTILDYGPAKLLVPYFMRRPYDMFLVMKDTSKSYLYELNAEELGSVAEGWHHAILAMRLIMPQIGREPAYNVITNNGPGAGLYFEFLPYTQETGGMEHIGLYLCQGNPHDTATQIKLTLAENLNNLDE